jgi:hypothetical protein
MTANINRYARHADIIEWLRANKASLRVLRGERYALEKGIVAYIRDFSDFVKEMRTEKKDSITSDDEIAKKRESRTMSNYYQSQELLKKMKWKRVTWDEDADYDSFAQRLMENDSVFSKTPAFSFLCLHVVRDPHAAAAAGMAVQQKAKLEVGDLTGWLTKERIPIDVPLFKPTGQPRRPAFLIDWVSGQAKVLDSASPQEMLTFLTTIAPRLQAIQVQMEDEQQKIVADVENVRVRVGLTRLKINANDASFWDDPKRLDSQNYITPAELRYFLDAMLKCAFLYRFFLKGHQVRVGAPGTQYSIDQGAKEVVIPANFADYNWLQIRASFEALERVFDIFRRFWWFWFCIWMLIVGDLEII